MKNDEQLGDKFQSTQVALRACERHLIAAGYTRWDYGVGTTGIKYVFKREDGTVVVLEAKEDQ